MTILKNRTKRENFLIVSKIFLQDTALSISERGLLATMHSLPDNWEFSIRGMEKILPDGEDRIRSALDGLIRKGYVAKKQSKDECGKFGRNIIEIYEKPLRGNPVTENPVTGQPTTEYPVSVKPSPENRGQYNTKGYSTDEYNKKKSIIPSSKEMPDGKKDKGTEEASYRELVAKNIHLDWLLDIAREHDADEVHMVEELYEVICDMVCYPRENVEIKGVSYPWNAVKSRFLKLRYQHVADVLNRLVDADLEIKNMSAYLISTLYTESLVGTLEAQSRLHDDYLKALRGKPY